jgi:hypothetical protein
MKLQQRIAREISEAQVGRTLRALVDQPLIARAAADAPDIDGRILLTSPAPVEHPAAAGTSRRATGSRTAGGSTHTFCPVKPVWQRMGLAQSAGAAHGRLQRGASGARPPQAPLFRQKVAFGVHASPSRDEGSCGR